VIASPSVISVISVAIPAMVELLTSVLLVAHRPALTLHPKTAYVNVQAQTFMMKEPVYLVYQDAKSALVPDVKIANSAQHQQHLVLPITMETHVMVFVPAHRTSILIPLLVYVRHMCLLQLRASKDNS